MVHLPIKIIISLENLSSNIGMISGISTWLKSSGRIRRSQKIGKKMAHESRFATGFEIWLFYTHPMGFFTHNDPGNSHGFFTSRELCPQDFRNFFVVSEPIEALEVGGPFFHSFLLGVSLIF